jgi:hypothetical protein
VVFGFPDLENECGVIEEWKRDECLCVLDGSMLGEYRKEPLRTIYISTIITPTLMIENRCWYEQLMRSSSSIQTVNTYLISFAWRR